MMITSDSDSTFLSNESDKIFHKYDIIHKTVPVGDHAALGIIDRFARTLKLFYINDLLNIILLIGLIVFQK